MTRFTILPSSVAVVYDSIKGFKLRHLNMVKIRLVAFFSVLAML